MYSTYFLLAKVHTPTFRFKFMSLKKQYTTSLFLLFCLFLLCVCVCVSYRRQLICFVCEFNFWFVKVTFNDFNIAHLLIFTFLGSFSQINLYYNCENQFIQICSIHFLILTLCRKMPLILLYHPISEPQQSNSVKRMIFDNIINSIPLLSKYNYNCSD